MILISFINSFVHDCCFTSKYDILVSKYYQNEEKFKTNHWHTAEREKTNDMKVSRPRVERTECFY